MAVYKGREVQILGRADGADTAPLYRIVHPNGNTEQVRFTELQLTSNEIKEQEKIYGEHLRGANKIEDKDLQQLRDSQDREKIEQNQKTRSTSPVEVNKVMVDPSEVQEKSVITPQMTTDQRSEKKVVRK